jgi:hypothetical protein
MQPEEPRTNAEKPLNRGVPLWLVALGSGLLAGSLAACGGELTYQALYREPQYPASFSTLGSSERGIARAVVRYKTKVVVETNQAMAAFGLLGAALGVVLALAGGLSGSSGRTSPRAAVVGGVLGGVAGAGISMAIVPLFFELSDALTAIPLILLTHATIFAGVGAAGGAALGWQWGDRKVIVRCVIGGIVGALVATLVVEVINVGTFGISRIFEPVPAKSVPRFVVHLGVALCTAVGAVLAGRKFRHRQS